MFIVIINNFFLVFKIEERYLIIKEWWMMIDIGENIGGLDIKEIDFNILIFCGFILFIIVK